MFNNIPPLKPLKDRWELAEALYYQLPDEISIEGSRTLYIPKGYTFDGASVPWVFTRIFPRSNPCYIMAACVHDYLLDFKRNKMKRSDIDIVFRDALLELEVEGWKVWAMYNAVKLYGLVEDGNEYYI